MTAISMTSVGVNPDNGRLESGFTEIAEGVSFIGTVGHGNTLRITDSLARFGTRTNAKPLFVNFGDSRFGNSLGRITSEHINSDCILDATVKNGSLVSSYRYDIKNHGDSGMIGQPITTQDQTKPLIQYVERRYGFDFTDPTIQNNGYYFASVPWTNTNVYTITIDGRTYTHTNDGTAASISNGGAVEADLTAQINADSLCKCTVTSDGTFTFRLVKKNPLQYFTVTYNSNVTQNFNNKTARIYAWNDATPNDAILLTYSNTSSFSHMENTTGNAAEPYYNANPEANAWMCEELVLKNSSAGGVSDGYYKHYKNSELLNPTVSLVTYNVGQQPLGRCYLNQFSNGPYGYWRTDLDMYVGYQCWDDEYRGIYFANSSTIVAGTTKLVRQPQAKWVSNSVYIQQVHSHVNPSGAHVYLRTNESTYIYLGQLGA
jgi:hypothetical protein